LRLGLEIVRLRNQLKTLYLPVKNFISQLKTLFLLAKILGVHRASYSTVTDLARFLGWSTSAPRKAAM
jgi:hypothetical protein